MNVERLRPWAWIAIAAILIAHVARLVWTMKSYEIVLFPAISLYWYVIYIPWLLNFLPWLGLWLILESRRLGPGALNWRWIAGGLAIVVRCNFVINAIIWFYQGRPPSDPRAWVDLNELLMVLGLAPVWVLSQPRRAPVTTGSAAS